MLFLLALQTNKAGHFSINMQHMDTANPTRSAALDLLRLQDEVYNLSHTQQVMETTITSLQRTDLLSGIISDKTFEHYAQPVSVYYTQLAHPSRGQS